MKKTFLISALILTSAAYAINTVYRLQLDYTVAPEDINQSISVVSADYNGDFSREILNPHTKSSIIIPAHTEIINMRDFDTMSTKRFWKGNITGPGLFQLPKTSELTFSEIKENVTISPQSVFGLGERGETFLFENPVDILLKIGSEGAFYKIAFLDENGIVDDSQKLSCIVKNQNCRFQSQLIPKILVYKTVYKKCPDIPISHGRITGLPFCSVQCESGYHQSSEFSCRLSS